MHRHVLDIRDPDAIDVELAGGKGARLAALVRVDGIAVPDGFVVTTHALRQALAAAPDVVAAVAALEAAPDGDPAALARVAATARAALTTLPLPPEVHDAVLGAVRRFPDDTSFAVRSSATVEDLATASFAGQFDSFLAVSGPEAVSDAVRRCWASLATDRAVQARRASGGTAAMAVVVQRMVRADASGVLFTADPLSGDRRTLRVEAVPGLGEALMAGSVPADAATVRDGAVVARSVAHKVEEVRPSPAGGTQRVPLAPERRDRAVLTDEQVLRLAAVGRRIEQAFGGPQDVEWCLEGDQVLIVQSRPITTAFPVPDDGSEGDRVYVSVGHQQMMTDPMTPLGLSVWQRIALRPMVHAAGRLFVDVTDVLATPAGRAALVGALGSSDPLIGDALTTVLDRGFVPLRSDAPPAPPLPGTGPAPVPTDPAVVEALVARWEEAHRAAERRFRDTTGVARFDAVAEDVVELKALVGDPTSMAVIVAGMQAATWLQEHLSAWLGMRGVADVLIRSVPGNVTSEMGLAMLDVADVIRPHDDVLAVLASATDDGFLDRLPDSPGGRAAREAVTAYLDRFGMRCIGEIDIARPRWSERPAALLPTLLGHVRDLAPGEARRRFEHGRVEAERTARDVLARLRDQPDGEERAQQTAAMIERVRTFAGYREYPKYAIVRRLFLYKQALMAEAARLVEDGAFGTPEDAHFLTFDELRAAVATGAVEPGLVAGRRAAFRSFAAVTPPRVLTSDGEALAGRYHRDGVPDGALVGLPVSAGVVEGRARVVLDVGLAALQPGDVLVTRFTDPSWTPLFVSAAALVTEVGGSMTHGAVIAREYGLPAVVGVPDATRRIADGRRIRVHGSEGWVELLD